MGKKYGHYGLTSHYLTGKKETFWNQKWFKGAWGTRRFKSPQAAARNYNSWLRSL